MFKSKLSVKLGYIVFTSRVWENLILCFYLIDTVVKSILMTIPTGQ